MKFSVWELCGRGCVWVCMRVCVCVDWDITREVLCLSAM